MLKFLDRIRTGDRYHHSDWAETPIVMGAVGGSGTRAFHNLLMSAGVFMGTNLNNTRDAMDFEPFLDEFINPILQHVGHLDYELDQLSPDFRDTLLTAFEAVLTKYRADVPPNQPWGWKNPRSMYILPIIQHFFPALRFVHVVRDGRYMAFSQNQNQVKKHYQSLFGQAPDGPVEVSAARLWAQVNVEVARWGWAHLGNRYLLIRFEDVCRRPQVMTAKLLKTLGIAGQDVPALAELIQGSSNLDHWETAAPHLKAAVSEAAGSGLERFGYL